MLRFTHLLILVCVADIPAAFAANNFFGNRNQVQGELPISVQQLLLDRTEAGSPFSADLQRFYEMRGFDTVWLGDKMEWKHSIKTYIDVINAAADDALDPADYPLEQTAQAPLPSPSAGTIAERDMMLTVIIMHYIRDVKTGRVAPNKVFPDLFLLPQDYDVVNTLNESLELKKKELARYFSLFNPSHPQYAMLRNKLAEYRAIDRRGGWPKIDASGSIKPGESDPRIPAIRQRLASIGWNKYLPAGIAEEVRKARASYKKRKNAKSAETTDASYRYDENMEVAIRKFQQERGTKVDGVIGPATFAALNVPVRNRIRQIELTMESWRWLPEQLGDKYVLVNIAGFYAEARENGKSVLHMPVVVGQVAHATPSFSSVIEDVKFYPDWSVPDSIAQRDVVNKIKTNPGIVDSLGYELYRDGQKVSWNEMGSLSTADFPPYSLRQKPGIKNALGMVRFSIDNPYSIYLHDTPKQKLFEEDRRAFSSGCIRVSEPELLANFLLIDNSSLSETDIHKRFTQADSGAVLQTEVIPLENKIPVHLVYHTAWVDNEGDIHFEEDIYKRDQKLYEALKRDG